MVRLWRQDDNGGRFVVGDFASRAEAEAEERRLAAGGHKQTYWLEELTSGVASLFADIPAELPDELFTTLLERPGLKLERIVSRGHATPSGQWYDQQQDEWVLLLSGSARLCMEDPKETIEMRPGDYLLIPAHRRHRIEATAAGCDSVWLALFMPSAPAGADHGD